LTDDTPRDRRPYDFWQVLTVCGLTLICVHLILETGEIKQQIQSTHSSVRPILDFIRDFQRDVSKSTLCVTHGNSFELHQVGGFVAKYYGDAGMLSRAVDTDITRYALSDGVIQLGMDYGMVIARVSWRDRIFLAGAPAGWGITMDELVGKR